MLFVHFLYVAAHHMRPGVHLQPRSSSHGQKALESALGDRKVDAAVKCLMVVEDLRKNGIYAGCAHLVEQPPPIIIRLAGSIPNQVQNFGCFCAAAHGDRPAFEL